MSPISATRPSRIRRLLRFLVRLAVAGLALTGAVTLLRPSAGVGHFRTAAGLAAYREAHARALRGLPAPDETLQVETDFGAVQVYRWSPADGTGRTPVLLLPGRSSGAPMWRENIPGILAHRSVLAIDMLGDAGLSSQTAPLTSMADQSRWLDQVVAQVAPGGVHLVGHSFGGASAATYALDHPERVRTLTLLDPVLTFAHPPIEVFGWATVASLPFVPAELRRSALARIGGGGEADPEDPLAQLIERASEHYSAELPTPTPLDAEQRRRLDLPTYVALAARNSLAGGSASDLAGTLPKSTVVVWPDTDHSLPMQVAVPLLADLVRHWNSRP